MLQTLRTLIVDDEPLAIERLQILAGQQDGVSLVGTASDGASALRMVEALAPDLLLCDIAMPDLDGLDVATALEKLDCPPAIVFVTAFDRYAVAAFDVAAVDPGFHQHRVVVVVGQADGDFPVLGGKHHAGAADQHVGMRMGNAQAQGQQARAQGADEFLHGELPRWEQGPPSVAAGAPERAVPAPHRLTGTAS